MSAKSFVDKFLKDQNERDPNACAACNGKGRYCSGLTETKECELCRGTGLNPLVPTDIAAEIAGVKFVPIGPPKTPEPKDTHSAHAKVLEAISILINEDLPATTVKGQYLLQLSKATEEYEKAFWPIGDDKK